MFATSYIFFTTVISDFDILREKGYANCIPLGKFTNISNSNPEGSESYDHIWITSSTKKVFSGELSLCVIPVKCIHMCRGVNVDLIDLI